MNTHILRSWTDVVKLHPDVDSGALTESIFAIDLGAIHVRDERVPVVIRPMLRPSCLSRSGDDSCNA